MNPTLTSAKVVQTSVTTTDRKSLRTTHIWMTRPHNELLLLGSNHLLYISSCWFIFCQPSNQELTHVPNQLIFANPFFTLILIKIEPYMYSIKAALYVIFFIL